MPRAQTSQKTLRPADPLPPTPESSIMRMTVYFQKAEWDALRDRAAADDTTMANLVRRAVRAHLKLK